MPKMTSDEIMAAGIEQAKKQAKNSKWPFTLKCTCGSENIALFAGMGMYDYLVHCYGCGKEISGNNLKHTLESWQRWLRTGKA